MIAGFSLLAGNNLVVKPTLHSPVGTLFLWKNIVHATLSSHNVPAGTVNVVIGNSETIVDESLTSPEVDDILFIGDTKTGLRLGQRAFDHGKKAILELAGNDMMFVWDVRVEGRGPPARRRIAGRWILGLHPGLHGSPKSLYP